jgi:hypothetical protein
VDFNEKLEAVFEAKKDPCWANYRQLGTKEDEDGDEVPNCVPKKKKKKVDEKVDKDKMKCNSPKYTPDGPKKSMVKACKDGKEKIVRFGDPGMEIKKDNPKNRKSFRARHNCDEKKDKFSAGYWSCKAW